MDMLTSTSLTNARQYLLLNNIASKVRRGIGPGPASQDTCRVLTAGMCGKQQHITARKHLSHSLTASCWHSAGVGNDLLTCQVRSNSSPEVSQLPSSNNALILPSSVCSINFSPTLQLAAQVHTACIFCMCILLH